MFRSIASHLSTCFLVNCIQRQAALAIALLGALACAAADEPQQEPARRNFTHLYITSPLQRYCEQVNLPLKTHGEGNVRVMVAGNRDFPEAASIARTGEDTIKALEIWSGQQAFFVNPKAGSMETNHIVLFDDDMQFDGFIDFLRANKILAPSADRQDLTKLLKSISLPLVAVTTCGKVANSAANFAVHATVCTSLGAFFYNRGDANVPGWLSEGLSAELQRVLCREVRWASISYELSSPQMQGNWALDVAAMIKRNDKMLRSASDIMAMDLISLPGDHYKLMWSLCTMLVQVAGNRKGPKNQFGQLLLDLAAGTTCNAAIKKVYKVADPKLTQVWFQWALSQR